MFKGIGASPGIAIGKILLIESEDMVINKQIIEDTEKEIDLLISVFKTSMTELENIKIKTEKELGVDEAAIFGAHMLILSDPELLSITKNKIESDKVTASYAFKQVSEQFISIFEALDDDYMRERAADIKDISSRVLRHLTGTKTTDLSNLEEDVILVTDDLTPSDTATMNKNKVLGFLTNMGGKTSHSAIIARLLEIPAIVGLNDITSKLKSSEQVIVNGYTGEVIVNPSTDQIIKYERLQQVDLIKKEELKNFKGQSTITLDGKEIELVANIGSPEDIAVVLENDAEGIGLFRTEFLYMNHSSVPTETEQFEAYKTVAEGLSGKPLIIRTLDIGGDKEVDYLNIKKENNPFLGYRAIRMCLCNVNTTKKDSSSTCDHCQICKTDLFRTQLRAILRASNYGNIKIMFPMISSTDELLEAKAYLEGVKKELDTEGISYNKAISIGMMIEVPSAAIISDILAKHVDFFSIGTNDLIQYTCAVDRMNQKIQHLYNPNNPAVLRLIKMIIDNGHKARIPVGMCGGMAEDPLFIPVLLGLGLDEFSVSPSSILQSRKQINNLSLQEMETFSSDLLNLGSSEEVSNFLNA